MILLKKKMIHIIIIDIATLHRNNYILRCNVAILIIRIKFYFNNIMKS